MQVQVRGPGQLVLKRCGLAKGFQGKAYKDGMREGGCEVCDQFVDILSDWIGGEVIGSPHLQPSGSNLSGVCVLNFFHLVGSFQFLQQLKEHDSECHL